MKIASRRDREGPENLPNTLGKLMRYYRKRAGLTQLQQHSRLNAQGYPVSESTISMWENDERLPSDPSLFHHLGICLHLGEDEEKALVAACLIAQALEYLETYVELKDGTVSEQPELWSLLFTPLLDSIQTDQSAPFRESGRSPGSDIETGD